jgi:hypothetical protein
MGFMLTLFFFAGGLTGSAISGVVEGRVEGGWEVGVEIAKVVGILAAIFFAASARRMTAENTEALKDIDRAVNNRPEGEESLSANVRSILALAEGGESTDEARAVLEEAADKARDLLAKAEQVAADKVEDDAEDRTPPEQGL